MPKELTGKRFESQMIPIQGGRLIAQDRVLTDIDVSADEVRAFMVNNEGVVNITVGNDEINGLRVLPGIPYPFFVTAFRTSPTTGAATGIYIFS